MVKAIAVSFCAMITAVALFWAVGVLVTMIGVGVRVARSMLRGVGVAVPVLSASAVTRITAVAAAKMLSGVSVAVTTKSVGEGVASAWLCPCANAGVRVRRKKASNNNIAGMETSCKNVR